MKLLVEVQTVLLGLVFQGIVRAAPLRRQSGPKDIRWDMVGVASGSLCVALYAFCVGEPLEAWVSRSKLPAQWHAFVADRPLALALLAHMVLADFLAYWAHRLLHSRLLWHSHAWHHSSRHVWWASGLRASPLHVAVLSLPFTFTVVVLPIEAKGSVLVGLSLFGIANQHWLHSNIRVPYARLIEVLFVTPRFHFVHHSADIRFTNSNYGFIFSVWDRLFGTYTNPEHLAPDELLGLDYDNSPLRLLLGLPPHKASAGLPPATSTPPSSGESSSLVVRCSTPGDG